MTFKCCAIIPSHNHADAVGDIVRKLRELALPVFIIDDGSDSSKRRTLAALHAPECEVRVYRFDRNRGKGAAVMHGFDHASAAGFTHALQIDADGQHDLSELGRFVAHAQEHPHALIAGKPVYDTTIPRARRIGRSITHFWVGIETLTAHPADTMCGLRVYPLARVMRLKRSYRLGRRMDFDIEILVRLIWDEVPIFFVPVRVIYPQDNVSNFDLIRDNLWILWMHTRLVLTMPRHVSAMLRSRRRSKQALAHWSSMAERGAYWGLNFLAICYRVTGRYGCMAAAVPIAFYFNLTSAAQRRTSREFLRRAYKARGIEYQPGWFATFKHAFGFARRTVDTFAAWVGGIDERRMVASDKREPDLVAHSGQGILLIVSHLGNIDISRALLDDAQRSRIKVLVHTIHAEKFARVLREFRPDAMGSTIQVTDIDPGTMFLLKEAIERGDWVALAGDRTPVLAEERISMVPFLGHDAPFPQGPYIIAHLLECPVYLMFCIRQEGLYRLYFERFADRISLPRHDRQDAIAAWAARYAQRLESFSLIDPFQWYNFFDFWQKPVSKKTSAR